MRLLFVTNNAGRAVLKVGLVLHDRHSQNDISFTLQNKLPRNKNVNCTTKLHHAVKFKVFEKNLNAFGFNEVSQCEVYLFMLIKDFYVFIIFQLFE